MYVVLWEHESTHGTAVIGPFKTKQEAIVWQCRHMPIGFGNGSTRVVAMFSPNVESISLPGMSHMKQPTD